ncbi:osmoprotectant transport system permease protein [Tamaricihabitans halophyticus]|uniref:Osmoprotectant transport system permease protein n=1 Tax=Tamaricihabitans halophyticus TaxID=1262583 RepID=A0A4R2QVJ8_9PSEU|nr:ABC transporter permease [Tamaricihabitans halophyticus]TCP54092.1 osmoprotectant transport system permease protein [Tamaricihabitans halophyticus]
MSAFTAESGSRSAERGRLFAQPVAVLLIVAAVLVWAFTTDLDTVEQESINASSILTYTWQHLVLSVVITILVLVIALPLGVMLTRRWAKPAAPVFLAIANIGQAAPAVGVLVLFFLWTGLEGVAAAAPPIAFYALLPVLRNTIVGIQQVDPALVDAGRGIGMSSGAVLRRIELPLAIPLILAGLRTSLVLAVGTATLAQFVNGGGLGEMIDTGYKLDRVSVLTVGAVLAVALALLVDWLGAVAERYFGPKGIG